MEQTNPKSTVVKVALLVGVVILVAVVSTLVQQWLFGKANIAVTSSAVALSGFGMVWQLWGARR